MNYLVLEQKNKKIIKSYEHVEKNEFDHVDAMIFLTEEWCKVATTSHKFTVYNLNTKKIIFNNADLKLMKKEIKRLEDEEKDRIDNELLEQSKKESLMMFTTPMDVYGYKKHAKGVCWHQYYTMKTVFASKDQIDGLICGRPVDLTERCVNQNCKRGYYFCEQHMCDIIEKKTYKICLHCMMEMLYYIVSCTKQGKKVEPLFGVEILEYSYDKAILSIKNLFKIICNVININTAIMAVRGPLDKLEKKYVKIVDIYSQISASKNLPVI